MNKAREISKSRMSVQISGSIYFDKSLPRDVFTLGKRCFHNEASFVPYLWTAQSQKVESFSQKVFRLFTIIEREHEFDN